MSGAARATFVAVLLLIVAGCGDDTVDTAKVEDGIEQSLSSATTQIKSVSCPDDVTKEKGQTFTCTAKLAGGGSAKVKVTQTTAAGGYSYSFKPGTVKLAGSSVEPVIEQLLAAQGVTAQVTCPDTIAVKEGETVTCTAATAAGATLDVTFTFSDDSGTVDSDSVETSE